ncbi:MAG: CAP domain-containing protein, partial [Polyangiaceae bacterium]
YPGWPPGQPPPGYAQPGASPPGYPPPGYPPPGNPPPGAAVGSAWTPFGELLNQLPQIAATLPPLPGLEQLPQLFPQWPWPGPPATTPPPSGNWPAPWVTYEDEVLRLTNLRRAQGSICGNQSLAPAPPVGAHPQLRAAARGHADDMARRDYFDHHSPEGTGPMQRAIAAGYQGGFVGENIAAGQRSPAEVVQAWIDSPGHCVNLMDPRFRFLGVGYLFDQNDKFGDYWVQNFGG